MTSQTYYRGTGKRKCAIAQVKIFSGSGEIIVNGRPYKDVFGRLEQQRIIGRPFEVTDTVGKYNVEVKVIGGGINGQVGAIRHGISRALVVANEQYKPLLRQEGLMTRDARVKERKKYGLKRARKAPQYTKR